MASLAAPNTGAEMQEKWVLYRDIGTEEVGVVSQRGRSGSSARRRGTPSRSLPTVPPRSTSNSRYSSSGRTRTLR